MPDASREAAWAKAFRQQKGASSRWQTINFESARSQLEADFADQKYFLREAIENKNRSEAKEALINLIDLRARQTTLVLKQIESEFGKVTDENLTTHMKKYVKDVGALTHWVEAQFP